MCEIHFFEPVLRTSCSICTPRQRSTHSYQVPQQDILIAASRDVRCAPYSWNTQHKSVLAIPKDRDYVHICGQFSHQQFEALTNHLDDLALVEIVPSVVTIVKHNLEWFMTFGVGIHVARRYRVPT